MQTEINDGEGSVKVGETLDHNDDNMILYSGTPVVEEFDKAEEPKIIDKLGNENFFSFQ